jgi:hypothetical protein
VALRAATAPPGPAAHWPPLPGLEDVLGGGADALDLLTSFSSSLAQPWPAGGAQQAAAVDAGLRDAAAGCGGLCLVAVASRRCTPDPHLVHGGMHRQQPVPRLVALRRRQVEFEAGGDRSGQRITSARQRKELPLAGHDDAAAVRVTCCSAAR